MTDPTDDTDTSKSKTIVEMTVCSPCAEDNPDDDNNVVPSLKKAPVDDDDYDSSDDEDDDAPPSKKAKVGKGGDRTSPRPEKYNGRTWQDDRIEKSRRVWEWWRAKFPNLTYFFLAARLVALVPISSASVERTFSQVKFIVETVGESVLEENLEARVMERVNKF